MSHLLTVAITPEALPSITEAIQSEPRLEELVKLQPTSTEHCDFLVDQYTIQCQLDWTESLPPVVLPIPLANTAANFLALVFLKLGNWEKVYEYCADNQPLAAELDLINRLQSGVSVEVPAEPVNDYGTFDHYRRWHNRAVVLHYGNTEQVVGAYQVKMTYEKALEKTPDAHCHAYTAKHFATFLLDSGLLPQAQEVLDKALGEATEPSIRAELKAVLYGIGLQQLTVPYDPVLVEKTKEEIWEVLQHYEAQGRTLQTGLLLIDAAQVANFTDSFAESLGYINRAIRIFREEEVPELEANAHYRKGILLFTWAQNGNVQFYKGAMEAYQQALKTFTQETAPEVFAEIQHHLGVIYSEIPDEAKKKSIWAAVSVSSFNHALAYFTSSTHPYEYAAICNHYANALTKYPEAKLTDNYRKALGFYEEALQVRNADEYPYERTLTLLNYLEACWQVHEEDPAKQRLLFEEMMAKAHEAKSLVQDAKLRAEADAHLTKLAQLKETL
jgi:tetratricopeptide (TPR) repeat protein